MVPGNTEIQQLFNSALNRKAGGETSKALQNGLHENTLKANIDFDLNSL